MTTSRIQALRSEAAVAGDLDTVNLCDRVLNAKSRRNSPARRRVAEILDHNAAQVSR